MEPELLETHMIDVGHKAITARTAIAHSTVYMRSTTLSAILEHRVTKGDVFVIAQVAGIQAAKKCADLIPLCHPLPLTSVQVQLSPTPEQNGVYIVATVKVNGQTGVEMEALTAVSVAALTVYDMCKGIDPDMTIEHTCLLEKMGGKSGHYQRHE